MEKKKTIKRIFWIILPAVMFFIYFSALDFFGKDYRAKQNGSTVDKQIIRCTKGWMFKSGDDKAWASTSFDDHGWKKVNSDSLLNIYHGELSWFRLHLKADSFFLKRQVVLILQHFGASEIYLDGNKIAGFGNVSSVKDKETDFDAGLFPINVDLQKADTHLIAIRYSNLHYEETKILSPHYEPAFSLSIADLKNVMSSETLERTTDFVAVGLGIFLFTLGFIHLLLYLFYRSAKENLFYSLFVFCYGLIFLIVSISTIAESPQLQVDLRTALLFMLNPCVFISMLMFIFWIFQQKFPRAFWVAVGVSIFAATHVLFGWPSENIYFVTIIWMGIFSVIVMVRGTWSAIKEKRPGFRILAIGVGTFATFIFINISVAFYANRMNLNIEFTNPLILIFILVALLSIPISMSVYLAYTSSRTNKDLKQKLSEVETLSAKSMEQEKEKQKILETQKETLEIQVKERTHEIVEQNKVIEEKNKDITDSLNYAKRIQEAILPSRELKKQLFPDSFVLFKPKDIVSGDFYWYTKAESWNERHRNDGNGKRIIASVDCTGHGVPGAFMSMIGNNLLSEITLGKGITKPSEILDLLHEGVRASLKQNKGGSETRDGMDIALLCFDADSTTIEYAGAQRPLWIIRKNEPASILEEIKPDKFSIGGLESADRKKFTNHSVELKKGDCIYIFSDGFADQFGGTDGKKFMSKRFKDVLLSIHQLPMNEQEDALERTIEEWKGRTVQIDDILVIGIRI